MSEAAWTSVDEYVGQTLLADTDPIFEQVLRANAAGGLPAIPLDPAGGVT